VVDHISPEEASRRMKDEGYKYIDVRSIPEFESGHPTPAVNIPLMHSDGATGGMAPNPDFLSVVQANYSPDTKLVLGCRTGQRSAHAAALLEQAGYETVVNMQCGFAGEMNQFGQVSNPGWQALGLPSGTENGDGVSYESLSAGP
jgi:rhodanese-related sulfurtransferase